MTQAGDRIYFELNYEIEKWGPNGASYQWVSARQTAGTYFNHAFAPLSKGVVFANMVQGGGANKTDGRPLSVIY